MPKQDPLIRQTYNASLSGSGKTVKQHKQSAESFVSAIRDVGLGVKSWENVTSKHLLAAVEKWKDDGLSTKTIHDKVSGVRQVAEAYGNDRLRTASTLIDPETGERALEARVYVTNEQKSLSDEARLEIQERLRTEYIDKFDTGPRLAAQMQLARELGLRHEESRKFDLYRDVHGDRAFVNNGTKAGRDRFVPMTDGARDAIEVLKPFYDKTFGNTMPCREATWESRAYSAMHKVGMGRELDTGATFHGIRHTYAQERFEQMTGFPCRVAGGTPELALERAGEGWQKLEQEARDVLKAEMGHGPDREDVMSQYLGSKL